MKRWMALLLAAALCFSLTACSGGEGGKISSGDEKKSSTNPSETDTGDKASSGEKEDETKYTLGETVSTDLVDFTLEDCQLAVYADAATGASFLKPTNNESVYSASIGKSLMIPSFTLFNKDRSGNIDVGGSTFGDLTLMWTLLYDNEEHKVQCFDLNNNGSFGMKLSPAAIIDATSGDMLSQSQSTNYLLGAGAVSYTHLPRPPASAVRPLCRCGQRDSR